MRSLTGGSWLSADLQAIQDNYNWREHLVIYIIFVTMRIDLCSDSTVNCIVYAHSADVVLV